MAQNSTSPPTPSGFKSLADLLSVQDNSIVSVVARVQSVLEDFIALTDFSTFGESSSDMETIVMFDRNGGWSLTEEPNRGDVVVLVNFRKKTGFDKGNPILYTKRLKSTLFFFNTSMQIFGKYPTYANVSSYTLGNPVYEYAVKMIDDWRKDPQSGLGEATQGGDVQSFYMALEDVFERFDTSRITTLRGKIRRVSPKVFELTDAPGWTVVVEGYKMEEEVSQRCDNEPLSYVELSHVRFLGVDKSAKRLHAKTTDRSTMLSVSKQQKLDLVAVLKGEKKKEKEKEKEDEEDEEDEDEEDEDEEKEMEKEKENKNIEGNDKNEGTIDNQKKALNVENVEIVDSPSPSTPPFVAGDNLESEEGAEYSEDDDIAAAIRSRCASVVPAEKRATDSSLPSKKPQVEKEVARDLSPEPSRDPTPASSPPSKPKPQVEKEVPRDLSPDTPHDSTPAFPPPSKKPQVEKEVARDLSPASSRDSTPDFPPPGRQSRVEKEAARDLSCDPSPAPRGPTPAPVDHNAPARKKIKTESPVSRASNSRVPGSTFASRAPTSTPIIISSQPLSQNERPSATQGPMFIMSEYTIPNTELPYLVVSGVVDEAGVADGKLWFRVYCEKVDRHFLVKIREEDEREFLGINKLNEETKLKVFTAWASLQEQVKVNIIPDEKAGEGPQYWSVGNSLELQM